MLTFPSTRPVVRINRSKNTVQVVDCPELQWWFVVPRPNEDYAYALYDCETLELERVVTFAPTKLESSTCTKLVEIEVCDNWITEREKKMFPPRMRLLASIDSENARFLSVTNLSFAGEVINTTSQDDSDFEEEWGTTGRHFENNGHFEQKHDGSWRTTGNGGLGEGTYDVTIGDNRFECMRIFDFDADEPFGGELAEAYVERSSGRTVYYREFSGRFYRNSSSRKGEAQRGVDLLELYPDSAQIVIDGELYVQCGCTMRPYDAITLAGLGATVSEDLST